MWNCGDGPKFKKSGRDLLTSNLLYHSHGTYNRARSVQRVQGKCCQGTPSVNSSHLNASKSTVSAPDASLSPAVSPCFQTLHESLTIDCWKTAAFSHPDAAAFLLSSARQNPSRDIRIYIKQGNPAPRCPVAPSTLSRSIHQSSS